MLENDGKHLTEKHRSSRNQTTSWNVDTKTNTGHEDEP